MDGAARSDATFLRPATKALTRTGRTSRWAMLPGWRRSAWRVGILAAVVGGLVGWLTHPLVTAVLGCLILAVGAGWVLWRGYRGAQHWRHRRAWVRPLHRALAPVLGVTALPSDWIDVPRQFTDGDHRIVLTLPDWFTGSAEARRTVTDIAAAKLALEDPAVEFRMTGRPTCVLRAATPPPAQVGLADVLPYVEAAPETSLIVGLGRKGRPIMFDLDSDSPHALISASTGAGKSVLVRALAAQALHRGGVALVLDVKRISQAWARGLANVTVARDVETIHDVLLWVRTEIDRRTAIADRYTDENGDLAPGVDIGPRLWIIAEEFNAMSKRLAQYWRKIKAKDAQAASPAIEALADVLYMGRALSVNVIATAQMATVNSLGDSAMRECMGWRALARHSMQSWRMLAGEVWPPPKRSKHPGRWQVVTGGEAHEMQAVMITPADARRYAMSGTVNVFPDMGDYAATENDPMTTGIEPVSASSVALVGEPDDHPIGLAEACELGIVPISLAAIRSARARDPEFPRGVGRRGAETLYSAASLKRWALNRPRASADAATR